MKRRAGLLIACVMFLGTVPGTARATAPTISSTFPVRGPVGRAVFINGTGFSDATAVAFNGTPATFGIRSDTRIRAIVPSGATTGPVTVTAGSSVNSPKPFTVQPNIVLILTDDQRYDELGHMPVVQSDLIDKGANFTNGFVVNPLCCPSRATILTGRYSHGTDVYSNIYPHGAFRTFVTDRHEDRSTIATWLHGVGYYTGLIGKYINGYSVKKTSYVSPGWDVWDALTLNGTNGGEGTGGYYNYSMSVDGVPTQYGSDPGDYSTDVFASDATSFIDNAPSTQPLFLYFAPRAPHGPATPPERYKDAFPNLPLLRPASYNEDDVSDKPAYIQSIAQWSDSLKASQDALYRRQYQSLLGVDDAVKSILDALKATGRLEDTLIVFASDNGLAFGEHRWQGKKVPYEESIRVPIIARYDALMHQTPVSDPRLLLNLDLAPTFASAGGASAPGAEGMSFLPLLDGSASSWRSDFLIEHLDPKVVKVPAYCAVRDENELYVKYQTGEQELYDLDADPDELNNVASDPAYASDKATLYQRLLDLCQPPPPGYAP